MDSSVSSSASLFSPKFRCFDPSYAFTAAAHHKRSFVNSYPTPTPLARNCNGSMTGSENSERKIVTGEAGYVLEDVPHLSDYIPDLPVRSSSSLDSLCFVHFYFPPFGSQENGEKANKVTFKTLF